MSHLLEDTANEELRKASDILKRGNPILGKVWTEDPTEAALADFRNMNAIFPGVPESHDSASQLDASTVSSLVDPRLLKGTTVDFSRSPICLAWLLHHADTILPLAREIPELNSETARVSGKHAWGLPSRLQKHPLFANGHDDSELASISLKGFLQEVEVARQLKTTKGEVVQSSKSHLTKRRSK